ncbi:MAG TPA: TAXI family TRAP transporter solute-binding subunit [Ramlibacter sp.]|nr:TAXI family TRAP transporter solute-binding subunit [Ramlibacter sp.]
MTNQIRYTLVSIREMLVSAGPLVIIAIAALVLTYVWLDPTPPKRVRLATGPAQSAYDEFGKRYKKALAANHIDVVLVPSNGSAENLRMLRENKADLGFVQGGSTQADENDSGIESLGSLMVEPLWLFYREDSAKKAKLPSLGSLTQLKGWRVNIGARGSGAPRLMRKMFEANGVDLASITISRLDDTPAVVDFLDGKLDAVVFASAPQALLVQMLLQTPGVKLMDFEQSEAYSRRFPFLTPVVLPRGVVDLARDVPPSDMRLVATTTSLLARHETHPAIVELFVQAARDIHGPAGWFNRARAYPTQEHTEFPLSREAERSLRDAQPFLQRYLPFWLANVVERMWLALGIILAILLPLSRVVPPLYQFRIRSRVFRWYGQLRDIESRVQHTGADRVQLAKELEELDARVGRIHVPLSYADELYALRQNIDLVRGRLAA